MRMPSTSESLSWRRCPGLPEDERERDRDSRGHGEERRGGREAGGGREREREDREGERSRGRDGEREREGRIGREGRGGREWERDRERERDRDRERERDRGRERGSREDSRGASRGRSPPLQRGRPRMTAEQAAALQGIAGELNTFRDDGSFMERVLQQQGGVRRQVRVGAGGGWPRQCACGPLSTAACRCVT